MSDGTSPTGTPRPDLNGRRIKHPDKGAVFLVDTGFKRLVSTPQIYNRLFVDWKSIEPVKDIESIPNGPPLSDGAVLVFAEGGDKLYLVDRGVRRLIGSDELFEKYGFSRKKVAVVPPLVLESVPAGRPLSP
ncbi:hypothetical protein [Roseimicrobium sp. ORNL1]|uniref:hypothetical protein n=1 Tax=Roseimicrobium sp. ORNL1 TaxID=2711231 RepID=UPI0013E11B24|nr:hypothetical protein [Roseimicrobium sp. ORNL1]QIF00117.1 hypothetical protein G5S37_00800 [Roseimicrobium sp. ORNL1]